MTKVLLRRQALKLRSLGKSYSQIKSELGISKSTLSLWLWKYPLTQQQVRLLRDVSQIRIEKYRRTMQLKRETKLSGYYDEEKKILIPLSKKELFIAGLFLYWGEGGKTVRHVLSVNNTDPAVLKFTLHWMMEALNIPKEKIQVYLHLYNDMAIKKEINFWSKELHMPKNQFARPYIKKSKRINVDHKGFGHGTCGLRVNNTVLKERILMAIKVVADYSNEEAVEF